MAARLGRVLYWLCSGVAGLLVLFAVVAAVFWIKPEIPSAPQGYGLCVLCVVAAGLVWLAGRAIRYVLAAE